MKKILVLDTEVTHLDTEITHLIEVCLMSYPSRELVFETRVNPGIPIPVEASNVHHITDDMVAELRRFDFALAEELIKHIESFDVVIGYNPDFDLDVLRTEFKRVGLVCKFPREVVCCKRMWDVVEPPPPRTLSDAYRRHVSPEGFPDAHAARGDVEATMDVFAALRAKYDPNETMEFGKYDPKRATWCGPTNHLKWNDHEKREFLIVTFGKFKGKSLGNMDNGMCQWITKQDFPEHVKRICSQLMTCKSKDVGERDTMIAKWANERDR